MNGLFLAVAVLAATGSPSPAVNVQLLQPSVDGRWFQLYDPSLELGRSISWRSTLSYSNRPLEYESAAGQVTAAVGGVTQIDVGASYQHKRLRLGAGLPLQLGVTGSRNNLNPGFGQPHVAGTFQVLQGDHGNRPSLAATARIELPSLVAPGLGLDGVFGGQLIGVIGQRIGQRWYLGAQIGVSALSATELEGAVWGSRLEFALASEFAVDPQTKWITEFTAKPQLQNLGQNAMEILVGAALRLSGGLTLRPAISLPLSDAPGVPRFRALVQIRRSLVPARRLAPVISTPAEPVETDGDGDGLVGADDRCPDAAEDIDGYQDADGCPEPTKVTVLLQDSDGEPLSKDTVWRAGELQGIHEATVDMPAKSTLFQVGTHRETIAIPAGATATVKLTIPAARGTLTVAVLDPSGQLISGAIWRALGPGVSGEERPAGSSIQVRPGRYELKAQAEGYRSAKEVVDIVEGGRAEITLKVVPARASITGQAIDIKESVYFETNKAVIKPKSLDLLAEIAELLKEHPELKRVRIEGHTDNRGAAEANRQLSQLRAEAVRLALIRGGVAPERLKAIGYGESRPLDTANTRSAWTKNRRVDFFVEERAEVPAAPAD